MDPREDSLGSIISFSRSSHFRAVSFPASGTARARPAPLRIIFILFCRYAIPGVWRAFGTKLSFTFIARSVRMMVCHLSVSSDQDKSTCVCVCVCVVCVCVCVVCVCVLELCLCYQPHPANIQLCAVVAKCISTKVGMTISGRYWSPDLSTVCVCVYKLPDRMPSCVLQFAYQGSRSHTRS